MDGVEHPGVESGPRTEQAVRVKVKQSEEARYEGMGRKGDARASAGWRGSHSLWGHNAGFLFVVAVFPRRKVYVLGSEVGGQGKKDFC